MMIFEIERKFLVAHDGWRKAATGGRLLRDGLVGPYHTSKVRVRVAGERAWLTVKGPRDGLGRLEFEYEIPKDHADEMLRSVCAGVQVEKLRYDVIHAGVTWEVDVYQGSLSGVILAEVELQHEDQPFSKPDWAGLEVSGDPRFKKAAMLRLRQETGRPLTIERILATAR
jgi:adenylate cyclase